MKSFKQFLKLQEGLSPEINQELSQIDFNLLKDPQWQVDLNQLKKYERGEAERVADSYGNMTNPPTDFKSLWGKIVAAAKNPSNLKVVPPQQIAKIDNFDSTNSRNFEKTINYLESKPRDWRSILKAFQQGSPLPAPVVIVLPNGINHLMSGNSRLMICRALKRSCKILFVNMN